MSARITFGQSYKKRLDRLKRRRDFLKERIEQRDRSINSGSYDRSEYVATRWAVKVIERCPEVALQVLYEEKIEQENENARQ